MTFDDAALLLERHSISWRPAPCGHEIEALEEGTVDGVAYSEWTTLPLQRMPILFWLGYCCPHC